VVLFQSYLSDGGDMPEVPVDPWREDRIQMEITVDSYGPEEQAMGWYSYLENTITFPFEGICRANRAISPLQVGDRLYEKGYISDPKGKAKSVMLSAEGAMLSEELFFKHFGVKESSGKSE
jgi:hypothetical protein